MAAAASTAEVVTPASAPASSVLLFKGEATDVGFPWAGAGLLLLLVALAVAARWQAVRSGSAPGWLRRWLGSGVAGGATTPGATLVLQSSVRLDAQTQLHVVQWEGRRLLVATSSNASPVLLDRAAASETAPEARA
jgi:hypothetical protein